MARLKEIKVIAIDRAITVVTTPSFNPLEVTKTPITAEDVVKAAKVFENYINN